MAGQSQMDTWVAEAQHGDRVALAKLLTAFHPHLQARTAARIDPALRTRCGPDDVLQEVYLDVARHIGRFEDRGPGSFLSWVHAILDHKLLDARRAAHCQARDIEREVPAGPAGDSGSHWCLLDHVYADTGTPSRVVRRQEALSALIASLADISEAHRQVLRWRFLEGLPVAEVALRLHKSEAAVMGLSKRGLVALREAMDRRGEFTRG